MKTKYLTRWNERETLTILDRTLASSPFRVFSKIRLIDVIGTERNERLSAEDRNFLMTSHLDFVVYSGGDYLAPVFAVEFDGPHHDSEPQITRDIRKNRLCAQAKLPLLRIREPLLEKHEQTTLLQFMIERFVAWNSEKRILDREIRERVSSMSKAEFETATEGGALDPSLDSSVLFNLDHPFPGVPRIAQRLFSEYSILTDYLRVSPNRHPGALCCHVGWIDGDYDSPYEPAKVTAYCVYRDNPQVKTLTFQRGRLTTPGVEVLCYGTVRFAMQWALPIEPDYDDKETPIDYMMRTGRVPIAFADLPGVHIPDIIEWFSEYLALREIEKWARNMRAGRT
jgi:hypothetical protein